MRVLMLASYFPKPENQVMGNWALSQAQAFLRLGMEVFVVSGTSWIPKVAARGAGARSYANCPASYQWGDLTAFYPRWPLYPAKPLRALLRSNPALPMEIAWLSIRGELKRLVIERRPDLVFAHHTQVNGYIAWRLRQVTGLPYLVTDHDFGEVEACRSHPARHRTFAKIVQGSSGMISVAKRMENLMRELFPYAHALTVHNGSGSPAGVSQPRPPEIASRLVIFSACAFYERKGIPLLVRAFSRIAARFPNAILRIAGDGQLRPQIEAAIQDSGAARQIQLLGQLPHTRVLQEMQWADVFALPGWDEPFATVFTEALSVGCPIVYASDGGITDVVADGTHGFAVEPRSEASLSSALEAMLSDPARRQAMGRAGKELFERKLHWDRNAAEMKSLFVAALARRSQQEPKVAC